MQCSATRPSLLQTILGLRGDLSRFSRTFSRLQQKGQEKMKFDHLDKTKDLAPPGDLRACLRAFIFQTQSRRACPELVERGRLTLLTLARDASPGYRLKQIHDTVQSTRERGSLTPTIGLVDRVTAPDLVGEKLNPAWVPEFPGDYSKVMAHPAPHLVVWKAPICFCRSPLPHQAPSHYFL
jgi:hypothetical protein